MIIDQFYSEPNGRVCFTREQGSNFAKQMANDFNPLHDADAKRFCIPGDLLFAVILPNAANLRQSLSHFAVSVDHIENLTGLDLFATLPDEEENLLESTSTPLQVN